MLRVLHWEGGVARSALGLGACALGLAACGGGGSASEGAPPSAAALQSFALRRDVKVANAGLIDARALDLNADGVLDLVECDFADRTLAIGLGQLDGSFVPNQFLVTPGLPWTLEGADFSGDGRIDLAVACAADGGAQPAALALFEQQPDGGFLLQSVFALPGNPSDLAAEPLAGAGRARLAVGLPAQHRLLVLQRSPAGELLELAALDSAALGLPGAPQGLEWIDLDGDGRLDLASAETEVSLEDPDRLVGYAGLSGGGFGAASLLVTPLARPLLARTSDVDGDGAPDLAVAQMDAGVVGLLRCAPGQVAAWSPVAIGAGASSACFADLDLDGDCDLVATLWKEQALCVRRALGGGQWGPEELYNVGTAPRNAQVVLLPGDSWPDVLCANSGDASILYGAGAAGLRAARGTRAGQGLATLAAADLDADGRPDALTIDAALGRLVLCRGNSSGEFEPQTGVALAPGGPAQPAVLALGDFNGDGRPDVLANLVVSAELQLLLNPGGMGFAPAPSAQRYGVGALPLGLAAGDVDGDGRLDALVGSFGDVSLQWLIGDGAGGLAPQAASAAPCAPMALCATDLDADGALDLALSGSAAGAQRLCVARGLGGPALGAFASFALAGNSTQLAAADLDGDGALELVAAQSGNAAHGLVLLSSAAGFAYASSVLPVGYSPNCFALEDLDADGDLDLLCPLGQGALRVALNDGAAHFPQLLPADELGDELPVPFGTQACAAVDVDLDGRVELLMVAPSSPELWVARGLPGPLLP